MAKNAKNGRKQPLPSFQFYPGDYVGSGRVQRMSWAERGVYMHLLCRCWQEGGWLSLHEDSMSDALGCDPEEVEGLLTARVLRAFTEDEEGRIASPRMLRELGVAEDFRERMAEAGKRGGKAKARLAKAKPSLAEAKPSLANSTSHPIPPHPIPPHPTPDPGGVGEAGSPPPAKPAPVTRGRAKVKEWDRLVLDPEFAHLIDSPKVEPLREWVDHLADRLQKAHTATGVRRSLRRIVEMTPDQFRAAVEHSVGNNYQGLYEDKGRQAPSGPKDFFQQLKDGDVVIDVEGGAA